MASKKVILLSGGPCVGKSTTAKLLFEHYVNSAYCDGDWCWCVNPYSIEDKRQENGNKNMAFLISTYLNAGFEIVIFSSIVLTNPDMRRSILKSITANDFDVMSFQLTCSEDTLMERHKAEGGDAVSFFWLQLPPCPGEIVIDTDGKTPDKVCKEICKHIDAARKADKEAAKQAEAAKAEKPVKKASKTEAAKAEKPAKKTSKTENAKAEKPVKKTSKTENAKAEKTVKKPAKAETAKAEKSVKKAPKTEAAKAEKTAKKTSKAVTAKEEKPAKKTATKKSK